MTPGPLIDGAMDLVYAMRGKLADDKAQAISDFARAYAGELRVAATNTANALGVLAFNSAGQDHSLSRFAAMESGRLQKALNGKREG